MNPPGFKEYVLDQLRDLPEVQCRAMFGGHGLYQGGTFFGILFRGRLYFKTDDQSRANYEARGMEPFIYEKPDGKTMTMDYHAVPAEVLENTTTLVEWAGAAISIAKSAKKPRHRTAKQPRSRSVTKSSRKPHSSPQ